MASLIALERFNLFDFNFSFYLENFVEDALFQDDNVEIDGVLYQDTYEVAAASGDDVFILALFGQNFERNTTGTFTSGTVNALAEFLNQELLYFVADLSIDAVDLFNAFSTPSISDDADLIVEAFSGDDTFELSGFDDVVAGFAGDDLVFGNGGVDTFVIFDNSTQAQIIGNANGSVTVTSADGTDTLFDVEFIEFLDTVVSLSESPPPPPPPPPPPSPPALLILQDGSVVGLSEGNVTVVGTAAGSETVRLAGSPLGPLSVAFDASFNVGGDIVQFAGAAPEYTIERVGSSVLITNGILDATIPVGIAGLTLRFDDGDERTLRFDATIGEVVVDDLIVPLTAPASGQAPGAALMIEQAVPDMMIEGFLPGG
ncbi:MAG: hypothetical protein V2I27_06690 [Erythrobacter sp.]|nr:hypothetical protein [Erythrobacter sp.]